MKLKFLVTIFLMVLSIYSYASKPSWDERKSEEQYDSIVKNERILSITAKKKWLLLPVTNGASKKNMALRLNGKQLHYFDIELSDNSPDWYAHVDISEWEGEEIEIWVDNLSDNSEALNLIKQSEKEVQADELYEEKQRGQFHFSPKRGWNNDPNGLVFYNKEYHLFFQHNPYGVEWGNMHWGHAVSKDLVHWKELKPALYPDEYGTMFSGGAVVDSANTSGFGSTENPAILLFYTAASSWVQGLAYSTNGRDFQKRDPILTKITEGNRDPKVIWHEPTQKWVMVLYVTKEDEQHTMHFFTSPNAIDWELASITNGGKGDDRYLFECPEFFELSVEGNSDIKKWILTGANSEYAIGTFDGKTFKPELERLNGQHGRDFYAAQTFSNEPKERRIEIGWWRTHTSDIGANFNQSMSIPMELKLVETSDGLRLTRTPVEELKKLRLKRYNFNEIEIANNQKHSFEDITAEHLEIRTVLQPNNAEVVTFTIRGVKVVYDVKMEELRIDGIKAPLPLLNNQLNLTIYVDRTGLEIFSQKGQFFMPVNLNIPPEDKGITIATNGDAAKLLQMDVYNLKSSWK